MTTSGLGSRQCLERNLGRFLESTDKVVIHKANSLKTDSGELLRLQGMPCRIFSVDGGHTPTHVINDVALAGSVLSDRGIVVVDDFENKNWPGVRQGLDDYLVRVDRAVVPVAYGNNKLYLCHARDQDWFIERFESARSSGYAKGDQEQLYGCPVWHLDFTSPHAVAIQSTDEVAVSLGRNEPVAWRAGDGREEAETGLRLAAPTATLDVPLAGVSGTAVRFLVLSRGRFQIWP